ncbi:hypothetical protein GGF32_001792 [Allomyces javanicus]|nr:hypothetical protein GGF32_001792 [Allomyces javanicus]
MDVDTIQLAQPDKPTPRLRPTKLYRALARRLPTFKADPATLLTNAQLQQDVRAMIALWLYAAADQDGMGRETPKRALVWSFRSGTTDSSGPAQETEGDDIEEENEDEEDDYDDASESDWSPMPRNRCGHSNDAYARCRVALLVGCVFLDPVPVADS